MARLFGTDGIRGVAGRDLYPELVCRIGQAAARVLLDPASNGEQTVIIGRDSRLSGEMLVSALTASFLLEDYTVWEVGILPTPVLAFLTRKYPVTCGVMVTASHNPVRDNGIKFFRTDGFKLSPEQEAAIEELVREGKLSFEDGRVSFGKVLGRHDLINDYREVIRDHAGIAPLQKKVKVVLDCAFGACAELAPRIFTEWGADLIAIGDRFDGARINVECGATHPERVAEEVVRHGADLGFAFDGDGDRVIAVDHEGRVVDGDLIIALLAERVPRYANQRMVVVTQMSNLGMEAYLAGKGYRVERTGVGDMKVLARMKEIGADLGGEQSGHIILRDITTTGDGTLVALIVASLVVESGRPLRELVSHIPLYPQRLTNLPLADHRGWREDEEFMGRLSALEEEIRGRGGRIFVRPSGTEPKVRILVEAEDPAVVEEFSQRARELFLSWEKKRAQSG